MYISIFVYIRDESARASQQKAICVIDLALHLHHLVVHGPGLLRETATGRRGALIVLALGEAMWLFAYGGACVRPVLLSEAMLVSPCGS